MRINRVTDSIYSAEWTMGLLLLPLILLALLLQGVKTGSVRLFNRLRGKQPKEP